MTRLLELGELGENHHMSEVDVGRTRVDPQLDAKGLPRGELLLQLPLGQGLLGPAQQGLELSHSS
jgi:hypothetical protein